MNDYILWLPSWYPGKLDTFTGDFIQRHAKALSAFVPVHVFYAVRDKKKTITDSVRVETNLSGNLTETIIYYSSIDFPIRSIDGFLSWRKYKRLYQKHLEEVFHLKGLPSAVHVHVPYKAGLIALWIKKKFNIEYFVTEHWAGYDRANPDNFFSRSWSFRHLVRTILENSKCVVPVNKDLELKLKQIEPGIRVKIIPNTVDTGLFYFEPVVKNVFRFVHYVSSDNEQKNTAGLLRVLSQLSKRKEGWECILYGPADAKLVKFTGELGLQDKVQFTGEISYEEVAALVRSASVFISFSNYENQPCSILEALCCGLPVIATRTGGVPEIINPRNGLLIDSKNENQLLSAIEAMMDHYLNYDRKSIAGDAMKKFSFETVGRQLYELYSKI